MDTLTPFPLPSAQCQLDPRQLILGIAEALVIDGKPVSAVHRRQFCEANLYALHDLLMEISCCSRVGS